MRALLLGVVLLTSGAARADEPEQAPPARCAQPPCACQDATHAHACLDAKACAAFCEEHGGPVEWHKKHRRHRGAAPHTSNESR